MSTLDRRCEIHERAEDVHAVCVWLDDDGERQYELLHPASCRYGQYLGETRPENWVDCVPPCDSDAPRHVWCDWDCSEAWEISNCGFDEKWMLAARPEAHHACEFWHHEYATSDFGTEHSCGIADEGEIWRQELAAS